MAKAKKAEKVVPITPVPENVNIVGILKKILQKVERIEEKIFRTPAQQKILDQEERAKAKEDTCL